MIRSSVSLSLFMLLAPVQVASAQSATSEGAIDPISYNLVASSSKDMQKNFCARMTQSLQNYANSDSKGKAQLASLQLVDQIKLGSIAEYLPMSALSLKDVQAQSLTESYVSTANVLKAALGLNSDRPVVLVFGGVDLRYLPSVQNGTDLIVLANSSGPVEGRNAEQAALVAERLNIRVNIVWYGAEIKDLASFQPASGLVLVAQKTGGLFISLGGSENPCGTKS